jgi:hypothetical protein
MGYYFKATFDKEGKVRNTAGAIALALEGKAQWLE